MKRLVPFFLLLLVATAVFAQQPASDLEEATNVTGLAFGKARDEVDAQIAHATALAEAEAIAEREWIVRERLLDLTRQASSPELSSFETNRLGLLLDLAKLELELIGWTRRRAASA